jgi:meso-butanediol dehydrogenase/(S,S)-butanediol dehydrogenase/diacetyl reductase
MELKGAVAIVTGGARGIGRGIVLELARAGSNVIIADLLSRGEVAAAAKDTAHKAEAEGIETLLVEVDVRDEGQTQAMARAALDRFEKIDVLVNNAGVISVSPVLNLSVEDWDRVLDVNLKGTFLGSKAVLPHMTRRGSGRIVNISSQAGKRGSAGLSHYCASKWGVIGFTQSLAHEVGRFGVTVNAVCPGEVDTAMWREHLLPAIARGGSTEEAWQNFIRTRVPLGRPQTAEEIGQAVVFLCRHDAITGEALNVTGGSEMA